ncbi:MAG TPA: cytochrome c peroxidase, partial [Woeseiaceae bacterium]|nr:cytochrome c peroxidase [Woeseiaceae bacterium]
MYFRTLSRCRACGLVLGIVVFATFQRTQAAGQATLTVDPVQIRVAARASGLEPLGNIPVPVPNLVAEGVVTDEAALIALGKALFWDQAVGSDGQACASCHFHAGADNRSKNQLNPDTRNTNPDSTFGNPAIGVHGFPLFGPNYTLVETDFPFHQLAFPDEESFLGRSVIRDTNDVASSQGAFNADFERVNSAGMRDPRTPEPDPVFNVAGANTRRVEPRNTPTNFNAVFNFANFWDGRAHNTFNGVSVEGPLDTTATILVADDAGALTEASFAVPNSSLASQAVGPPASRDEMSTNGRLLAAVGKKIVNQRPLQRQLVHPDDSVLGHLTRTTVRGGKVVGPAGLETTYTEMIQAAFHREYWSSSTTITFNPDGTRNIGGASPDPYGVYSQIEANFAL